MNMNKETLLNALIGLYIAVELVSNATAGRLVTLGPFVVPGGLFLYSMTFTMRDAIHTAGGLRAAKSLIWIGLAANALLAGYGLFVNALPKPEWFQDAGYQQVFGTAARVVGASLVAYWVATYLDTLVFERLKRSIPASVLGSNLISTVVDTVIFATLAFAGTGAPLLNLMLGQVVVKLVVSTLVMPLVYGVRMSLRRSGLAVEGA